MIKKVIWKYDKGTRDMISQLINDQKLFPVFGSGFTAGCIAKSGVVPSGKDMITYMVEFLSKRYNKPADSFRGRNFSDLCTLYSKKSTTDEKFDYFRHDTFLKIIKPYEYQMFLFDTIAGTNPFPPESDVPGINVSGIYADDSGEPVRKDLESQDGVGSSSV